VLSLDTPQQPPHDVHCLETDPCTQLPDDFPSLSSTGADAMLNDSADISALLAMVQNPESSLSEQKGYDLPDMERSQYQSSNSSSSGHSSPQHEPHPEEVTGSDGVFGFAVEDIDMWEVLEVLEGQPQQPAGDRVKKIAAGPYSSPIRASIVSNAAAPSTEVMSPAAKVTGSHKNGETKKGMLKLPPVSLMTDDLLAEPSTCGPMLEEELLDPDMDTAEEKRQKRMKRNRESAAMSRNRKKQYIEELEAKVASLSSTVEQLQAENWALKQECATGRPSGQPLSLTGPDSEQQQQQQQQLPPPPENTTPLAGQQASSSSGKRLSTANLALMSALTFVTLSVGGRQLLNDSPASQYHSPTSRVLMSLNEAEPPSRDLSALLRSVKSEPFWPAVHDDKWNDVASTQPTPTAAMLPSPPTATRMASPRAADSHRVIQLPQNSSWADALRLEAEELQMASQLAAKQIALASSKAIVDATMAKHPTWEAPPVEEKVYEPLWEDEEDDALLADDDYMTSDEAAAERFIFCSRAYVFDRTRRSHARTVPHSSHPKRRVDLKLPDAMPARFRHAAQQSAGTPQLTDGQDHGIANDSMLPSGPLPVVSLLLPSATLRGIVPTGSKSHLSASQSGSDKPDNTDRGELVQVSCQVLNASRWSS